MLLSLDVATFLVLGTIGLNLIERKLHKWNRRYLATSLVSLILLLSVLRSDSFNNELAQVALTNDNFQALLLFAFGVSLLWCASSFVAKHRNRILTLMFVLFALSALFALPYEPMFNVFTPRSDQYAQISVQDWYLYVVQLSGKGGISAGNPLTFMVMAYTNRTTFSNLKNCIVESVYFTFNGSLAYPVLRTTEGVLLSMAFGLQPAGTEGQIDKWVTTGQIIYFSSGDWHTIITTNCVDKTNPYRLSAMSWVSVPTTVHVSSEDVTVLAKTNAYLLSLSFAFLAFACIELRVEDDRHNCEKSERTQNPPDH